LSRGAIVAYGCLSLPFSRDRNGFVGVVDVEADSSRKKENFQLGSKLSLGWARIRVVSQCNAVNCALHSKARQAI
jgi:hypothetical protein